MHLRYEFQDALQRNMNRSTQFQYGIQNMSHSKIDKRDFV